MGNKLRDRVLLRVDGGFKTGWDVAIAALLGGEEYGSGTAAMIAEGCIMARVCHTNKCPVGVTSQLEQFRKRFPGTPEHVVNFLYFVAEEVRQILAKLGYKSLKDIIGRSDLLAQRQDLKLASFDLKQVNLDCLIKLPDTKRIAVGWSIHQLPIVMVQFSMMRFWQILKYNRRSLIKLI